MEWVQFITIIATILGGVLAFYKITRQEICEIREEIAIMKANHREDMQKTDEKWTRLFEKTDEKWTRLFEMYLVKNH